MVLQAKGVRIHYEDSGSGEPVVFLHGALIDAATNWRSTCDALNPLSYRTITPDLRGHGKSEKLDQPAAYGRALYEDVIALLDHLSIPAAHVAGYSLGGKLALRMASEYPERVKSLIVGGEAWTKAEEMPDGEMYASAFLAAKSISKVVDPEYMMPREMRELIDRNDLPAVLALCRSNWQEIVVDETELARLSIPVRFIVGALDPEREKLPRLRKLLPNAEIVELPKVGHNEAFLAPGFADAVVDFLNRVSG